MKTSSLSPKSAAKAGGETVDVVIDDLLRTVPRPRPEKADRHGR